MGRKLYLLESRRLEKYDTFEFGVWKGKPIKWQVLDVGSGLLCISKYCLEQRRYDKVCDNWEKSELRQWLNSDFYNRAFTSKEKSFLMPYEGDKVTLLSASEAREYLPSKFSRIAKLRNGNEAWWWLRSYSVGSIAGSDKVGVIYTITHADMVISTGTISYCCDDVNSASGAVRPVIYLKKDIENFLEPEA